MLRKRTKRHWKQREGVYVGGEGKGSEKQAGIGNISSIWWLDQIESQHLVSG